MKYVEEGRWELNRREKQSMERLLAMMSDIRSNGDALKERLKQNNKRGWMFLQTALGLFDKAMGLILDTMPTKQLVQLRDKVRIARVEVTCARSAITNDYHPMSIRDANVILGCVVNEHCALCVEDEEYARHCPIRSALMNIWPPQNTTSYEVCPYQNTTWDVDGDTGGDSK